MIFIARVATIKAMMNGNFSITGMCLLGQRVKLEIDSLVSSFLLYIPDAHYYMFVLQ
jgi:hypothetical protein